MRRRRRSRSERENARRQREASASAFEAGKRAAAQAIEDMYLITESDGESQGSDLGAGLDAPGGYSDSDSDGDGASGGGTAAFREAAGHDLFAASRRYQEALSRANAAAKEAGDLRDALAAAKRRRAQDQDLDSQNRTLRSRVAELELDLRELRFERNRADRRAATSKEEGAKARQRARSQLSSLRSALEAVEQQVALRSEQCSVPLREVKGALASLERHLGGGYHAVGSHTAHALLRSMGHGLAKLEVLVGAPPAGLGAARSRLREDLPEGGAAGDLGAALSALSSELESENLSLRGLLRERDAEISRLKERSAAAALLPQYRKVVERAARHAEALRGELTAAAASRGVLESRLAACEGDLRRALLRNAELEGAAMAAAESIAGGEGEAKAARRVAAAALSAVRDGLDDLAGAERRRRAAEGGAAGQGGPREEEEASRDRRVLEEVIHGMSHSVARETFRSLTRRAAAEQSGAGPAGGAEGAAEGGAAAEGHGREQSSEGSALEEYLAPQEEGGGGGGGGEGEGDDDALEMLSDSDRTSVLENDVREMDAEIAALRRSIERTASATTAEIVQSFVRQAKGGDGPRD